MDLFDKCHQFTIAREAMAAGIYPYFTVLDDNSEARRWSSEGARSS